MGDVLLDAFLDTLKILPFLLLMNFVIEIIEYKSKGLKANRILKGGGAPLLGTVVGVLPQCGFSVVATELYSERRIALGALLAVYIATSDEALLIMLSSREGVVKILPVLIVKVCFALIVGYSAFLIEKLTSRKVLRDKQSCEMQDSDDKTCSRVDISVDNGEEIVGEERAPHGSDEEDDDEHAHAHIHGCHHHSIAERAPIGDGATKKQKAAHFWRVYMVHPLVHTATVIAFILAVNVLFGVVVYYVGTDRLAAFMSASEYAQPFVAALVGLIPNCASSVVITELYIVGGLSLGGAVAGLCMSAGIGYAVLIRRNRPIKKTVAIIVAMYMLSAALGAGVTVFSSLVA